MPDQPLAFHITFGTYGTRLHGDERTTVDRKQNQFGTPFIEHDDDWRAAEEAMLKYPPVILTDQERAFVEDSIPLICIRGGWRYHIAAAQSNHVHTLLSANAPGKVVRKLLKRWLGQALDEREAASVKFPRGGPRGSEERWFAVGGSVKCVWDDDYYHNAYEYIAAQRMTVLTEPPCPQGGITEPPCPQGGITEPPCPQGGITEPPCPQGGKAGNMTIEDPSRGTARL